MVDVHVGVGSNIEPLAHLTLAVAALGERFVHLRCSAVYRSPAFGFAGDDFLNMVIGFETSLDADRVDELLSEIEYAGGRTRRALRYSPRTLDLDLLLYGQAVDPRRRLPREDVCRYPFVLAPLAELAPELRHPVTGRRLEDEWAAMASRGLPLARLGRLAELV